MKNIQFYFIFLLLPYFSHGQFQVNDYPEFTLQLEPAFSSSLTVSMNPSIKRQQVSSAFPFVYSISFMVANLVGLVATHTTNHEPSYMLFKQAFLEPPQFDHDPWPINYIAHPIMGSESYLRGREYNYGYFGSFLFSTFSSFTWEYVIESWVETPSIQDLIITSTAGSLLGEIRHFAKQRMNPKHHWIVDPLHCFYLFVSKPKRNNQLGEEFSKDFN